MAPNSSGSSAVSGALSRSARRRGRRSPGPACASPRRAKNRALVPRPQPRSTASATSDSCRSAIRASTSGRVGAPSGPQPLVLPVPLGAVDAGAAEPVVEPLARRRRRLELEGRVRRAPRRSVHRRQQPVGVGRRRQLPALERRGAEREDPVALERRPDLAHQDQVAVAVEEAAEDVEPAGVAVALLAPSP